MIGNEMYHLLRKEIGMEDRIKEMKNRLEGIISYLFGKYDMRRKENYQKMDRLLKFCMEDIEKHTCLLDIKKNEELEFFVIQSMIYML